MKSQHVRQPAGQGWNKGQQAQHDEVGQQEQRHRARQRSDGNAGGDRDGRHQRADAVTMAARARMPGRTGTHTGKVPARS